MSTQEVGLSGNVQIALDAVEMPVQVVPQEPTAVKILSDRDPRRIFYGALSEIQAELEDLQHILDSIRKGQTIIPTYANYIETTKKNLRDLMACINSSEMPEEVKKNLHAVRHLNNAWEQMQVSPLIDHPQGADQSNGALTIQQQLHYLDLLDEQIHMFNYQLNLLSIPEKINQRLQNTGAGYYVPFHEVFDGDLPDRADRDRLLKHISLSPGLIPSGFVDLESGRIYHYSNSRSRRLLSLGLLLLGLGAATGIVAAACLLPAIILIPGWPLTPASLPNMLIAWVAVLIGMAVHILVGSPKRSKTQNGMPSVLMDLILIIDARFNEILMKLMLGLLGLFGLVMISSAKFPLPGIPDQITSLAHLTAFNAFLVGYSLDSILELFGTGLEGTSQVKSLLK